MIYNLNIDDIIGSWGYSKQYIREQLASFKGKPINVRISSLGGSVDHALDIRQQFIDHGDVTAYLYGCVASAATIIALGAKKVCASKYSMFMVHKVSNWIDHYGQYNSDEIQELIEQLKQNKLENDKYDIVLASMYAEKCKKSIDDILGILKEGNWMTAQEAKELGFIDEIIEDDDDKIDFAKISEKLNILGMPALPKRCTQSEEKTDESISILRSLTNKIEDFFNSMSRTSNSNIGNMKKDYQQINAVLNVEGIQTNKEGAATLDGQQLKLINEKLDEQAKKIDEMKSALAQKEKEIKNLQDAPGDGTKNIEGSPQESKANTAKEMYDRVKDFI